MVDDQTLLQIATRCGHPEDVLQNYTGAFNTPSQADIYEAWNYTHPQSALRSPPSDKITWPWPF